MATTCKNGGSVVLTRVYPMVEMGAERQKREVRLWKSSITHIFCATSQKTSQDFSLSICIQITTGLITGHIFQAS